MSVRFDLLYGPPGSGKTRALLALIEYLHKQTGKKARVFVGDGSGEMYRNSGMIEDGIIDLMDFAVRDYPFMTCEQITKAMWPKDVDNPASEMVALTPKQLEDTGLWIF